MRIMFSAETWFVISHFIVAVTMSVAILILWHNDASRPQYLLSFGLAYLTYSIGVVLQVTPQPSQLQVMLSGTLFTVAVVLLTHGLVRLAERRYSYWLPTAFIVLMLACRLYFVIVENNPVQRFFVLHITITIILLHGAYLARRLLMGNSAEKIVYVSFLILAASTIPRSLLALPGPASGFSANVDAYWLATQVTVYVFSIVFGLSLTLAIMHRRIVVHRALSESDALTGLRNRRGFFNTVERRIQRTDYYTVLVADIDHFKKVNDTYGHSIGDIVLTETADIIDSSIRAEDISGRIGGEEFAIFLPDTPVHEGHDIAERLRQNFERFTFGQGKADIRCTISLGVAQCDSSVPIDDAILKADQRLYEAKAAGRNQVRSPLSYR